MLWSCRNDSFVIHIYLHVSWNQCNECCIMLVIWRQNINIWHLRHVIEKYVTFSDFRTCWMILTSKIPLRPRLTHAIAKIGLNTKRESEPKHAPCMLKCLREIASQDVEKSMLLKNSQNIPTHRIFPLGGKRQLYLQ